MSTIEQIEAAIRQLDPAERGKLWQRLDVTFADDDIGEVHEDGNDAWDRQMIADAKAGKFADLSAAAKADAAAGRTQPIP